MNEKKAGDFISREAAIEAIKQTPTIYGDEIYAEDAIAEINAIPAADVVERKKMQEEVKP